jgi:hypothetical protein
MRKKYLFILAGLLIGGITFSIVYAQLTPVTTGPYYHPSPAANDECGWSVAAGDVNGDGKADVIMGCRTDDNTYSDQGSVVVFTRNTANTGFDTGVVLYHPSPRGSDYCGWSVAAGDVNNDGKADVIMGCPYDDNTYSDQGTAVVFTRNAANTGFDTGVVLSHPSPANYDNCGMSVAAGDVNNDGKADVIMGCLYDSNTYTSQGSAIVFTRNTANTGFNTGVVLYHPSPANYDECGWSVAAGDVNGDAKADVLMSCIYDDNPTTDQGTAVVFTRNTANTGFDTGVVLSHSSPTAGDMCGDSVAAGDVNKDLKADVIMGCAYDNNPTTDQGTAVVFTRNAANTGFDTGVVLSHPSPQASTNCGTSVAAGDVNNDGKADVIMGCPYDDNPTTDQGTVVFLTRNTANTGFNTGVVLSHSSPTAGDMCGDSVAAGDVNQDGKVDVIMGCYGDDDTAAQQGSVVVTLLITLTSPTVTTELATVDVQNNQATLKGNITATGGASIDKIKFVWGTSPGSYPSNSGEITYTGTFEYALTGMSPGTIYYYKAQAHNSAGWSDLATTNERKVVIYTAAGGQKQFITCQCSTSDVGGCCDGCNYCPAGKVFNGSGCVDATATTKCASTVNKCTAGNCSGEKRYPECQAGGVCDSAATTYYTSETVYASANKVLTTTCTDQDATSASLACDANTNYWCTEGSCSGYYRYSECNGAGTCDGAATTYYQQYNVVASTGYTLTSTCGTTGTTLCGYSSWNKCGGVGSPYSCQKGRDQLRCDAAQACAYDVGDNWANVAAGYVCSAGSEIALSCTYYCGPAGNYCTEDRYKGQFRQACGGTGSCNGATIGCNGIQDCGATSNTCSSKCQKDYTYTCSAGTCGSYHSYTNASQGYYCSGGSLINTGSCAVSAYNARSADKCDKKRDLYRCDGLGGTDANCIFDVGDEWAYVSAYKIANSSGQEVDASSTDNTGTCHSCTEGSCSGTLKWGECDGSGNPGPCATYNQPETVYPTAGFTLTSTCGTTGTTNCDTNICWDGGGHHEKCDRRCNAAHSCDYYNCVNHCTNTVKDCDETGIDCGGSCPSCDITPPTTKIKIFRKSTGEDLTAAGSWLRADTYTITFEDHDQSAGSGSNCENCSCEYSIYSCDVGGTNCTTPVVSLTSRIPNSSFDIVVGKTAPTYNLEGVGRYRIYSGAKDMANYSATEYRYINFDFTPPRTEIR